MKNDVKKKYQLQRKNYNKTGAAPIDITFSPLDERISAICNKQLLDGDDNIGEIGFALPKRTETPSKSVFKERNEVVSQDDVAGPSSRATPLRRSARISSKRTSCEISDEIFDDDSPSAPPEKKHPRLYRSHNTQLDRALDLQEKQVALLEKIAQQSDAILAELKKMSEKSSN